MADDDLDELAKAARQTTPQRRRPVRFPTTREHLEHGRLPPWLFTILIAVSMIVSTVVVRGCR